MLSIVLVFLLLLLGCTAPHDNPLDPNSKHYLTPQPVGRCCYGSQQCLDTTETRCAELGGTWSGFLTCASPCPTPYEPDFSVRVWSEHIAVSPTSEIYQVRTEFNNPDSTYELDSIWVVYDGRPAFHLDQINGTWGTVRDWSVFQCGQFMECVMGQPFTFHASGPENRALTLEPLYLIRVIAAEPTTDEPDSFHVAEPRVRLQWPPYTANFGYGFQANLVRTDTAWAWTSSLLPRDQYLVYPSPDSLPDGNYYWTLSVIDSFSNLARSQRAYFSVLYGGAPE